MKRVARVAVAALLAAWAGSVSATEPPDHVEREVVGWTGTSGELVVRTTARGERPVDGVSKDYYFQLTEMRDPADGRRLRRYRYGEPSGVAHPHYEAAESQEAAETFLDDVGLREAEVRWTSPEGKRALATHRHARLEPVQHERRGRQFVCVIESRLALLSPVDNRVFVLETWTERSEPASRREDVGCPRVATRAHWHPDGTHWALVRRVTIGGAAAPPEIHAGAVETPSAVRTETLSPSFRPLESYVARLGSPFLREGDAAMRRGDYEAAASAFERAVDQPARRQMDSASEETNDASEATSPDAGGGRAAADASSTTRDAGASANRGDTTSTAGSLDAGVPRSGEPDAGPSRSRDTGGSTAPDVKTSPRDAGSGDSDSPPADATTPSSPRDVADDETEGTDARVEGTTDATSSRIDTTPEPPSEAEIQRTRQRALFGLAMVRARLGDVDEAADALERAEDLSEPNYWTHAWRAAVFVLLDVEAADRHLARARELADDFDDYRRIGELFQMVDANTAHTLLVEALQAEGSDPSSETYRRAYTILVDGLIASTLFDEAETLLDKVGSPSPRMQFQRLLLSMERTGPDVFEERDVVDRTARALFDHPGVCTGYLLHGRALAEVGRLAEARPLLHVARVCDPERPEIHYYLAAVEMRIGDRQKAIDHFETFRRAAAERIGDDLRAERRAWARRHLERLRHDGVVLSTVACEPARLGALECGGVLENHSESMAESIDIRIRRISSGDENTSEVVAETTMSELAAGESQPFSLQFSGESIQHLRIEAGRDDEERSINRMPAVFE